MATKKKRAAPKKKSAPKKTAKPASARPAASTKPNFQKMLMKPPLTVLAVNAPANYRTLLGAPKGSGVDVTDQASGGVGAVHVFVENAGDIQQLIPSVILNVDDKTLLWVSYKKGDKALHRDTLWAAMKPFGVDGVALVALDDTWSAMRFRKP